MNFIGTLLCYSLSVTIGYLLLRFLTRRCPVRDTAVNLFLGAGLGLGISALITFGSFIVMDCYNQTFVLSSHALLLAAVLFLHKRFPHQIKTDNQTAVVLSRDRYQKLGLHALLFFATLTLLYQYQIYPFGGWDAWQVWNFKAKMLFLGGGHWRNMFLPSLWQTSPHYPLLLPLVNVWGWTGQNEPAPLTPFLTAFVFTYATLGLLFSALFFLTGKKTMIIAPLLLISLPFFSLLASSQYCDIVSGFYILSILICILFTQVSAHFSYALAAGLLTGLLAFTKPEGTLAAGLLTILGTVHIYVSRKNKNVNPTAVELSGTFLGGLALGLIPALIFYFLLSPGNQTFINGLINPEHPTNIERLKMVFAFLWVELRAAHWNSIWALLAGGLVFANRRALTRKEIIPSFLLSYLAAIIIYYGVNTYFEILWWLQVSLHRILFSLLPAFVFWIFYSIGEKE